MARNRRISRTFSSILILIVLAAALYWLFGLVRAEYWTSRHLAEFDLEQTVLAHLEEPYKVKIVRLPRDGVDVQLYAYTANMGVRLTYYRVNDGWYYLDWQPAWSKDGTDSLVFPYLHHSPSGRALLVLAAVVALPLLFFTTYRLRKARKGV